VSRSVELEPLNSGTVDVDRLERKSAAPSQSTENSRPTVFLMTDSFQTGGSERQFVALASALHATSYQVRLGCLQRKGTLGKDLGPVEHFDLGGSLYRLRSLRTRYRLARYLRHSEVAIAHAFDFYTNLVLIPAAKLGRTSVIIGSQRQLGNLLTPLQRLAQLAMFGLADCVICNSKAAAIKLIEQGLSEDKLRVIGNGLQPSAFSDAEPLLAPRAGLFRIGMIARMNARFKNHRILLSVAARLKARQRNFEVVMVGDGPLRPELESFARQLGVREFVHFLGDRRDIPSILASLDVTVLPSASESLSNAILESMAAGVPVVATKVGGNTELLDRHRGILIPPDDEGELENALLRMAEEPGLRESLGRNAKQFAQENFTIEQMCKRHEQLYLELLEKKGWRAISKDSQTTQRTCDSALRVAIVAPSLRYVGGQSVQADLLARHWQRDADVEAALIAVDPRFPTGLKWAEKVPGLRTVVRQPFYFLNLWRGLKHSDIVHVFSASYWSFLLAPMPAWLIARLQRKKVLLHYHSGEARDHLRRFRTARFFLRKMDRLVVPSGYLENVFAEFGLKADIVPNILDLSQFRFRMREPLRPYLICTRGFHPYYRADLVVQAFAEVQEVFPQARLDLVGIGPLEHEIRALVEKLNLSGVHFLGAICRQKIGQIYDQADIFVNASCIDNMPVSILEAFAAGTPVVSSAPEGMKYVVENERTGLLSPPSDAGAIARNILRLLHDHELSARLAQNAYEEASRYRWDCVRELWLDAYRSLADRPQRAASSGLASVGS
jgi:glycosyltransferase involved in cell wall biosynthesis